MSLIHNEDVMVESSKDFLLHVINTYWWYVSIVENSKDFLFFVVNTYWGYVCRK